MKFRIITLTLLLSALFGCGKFAGAPVTKTLDIENTYTEIHICDAIEVIMTNTTDEAIITAGENVISDVIIYENGDKLEIQLRDGIHYINSNVRILLPYNTELIKATLEDASYIESLINADDFVLILSDASEANLQGHIERLTIDLEDASALSKNIINRRYALSCDECVVSMSDASDAYIHCDGSIDIIELSDASDLHYTGNADIILTGGMPSSSSHIINDVL